MTQWACLLGPPCPVFPGQCPFPPLSLCHSVFGIPSQVPALQSSVPGVSSNAALTFGGESYSWRPGRGVGEAPPRLRELRPSFFLRPLCRLQPSPTPSPPLPNPSCLLPTHSNPMAWPQVSPELPSTIPESTESPNPVVLATQGVVSHPRTAVCPLAQARPICRSKPPSDLKIETSLITQNSPENSRRSAWWYPPPPAP